MSLSLLQHLQQLDLRTVDTMHALSALSKYLDVTETQMAAAEQEEMEALKREQPADGDDDDWARWSQLQDYTVSLYEEDLRPAMRYSFVVFLQIVLETRLARFCSSIQQERQLPLKESELRGSSLDRAKTFLVKLAGMPLATPPAWNKLRDLQKVRDCIVHANGYVAESRDKKDLEGLAGTGLGMSIDDCGRLAISKDFCVFGLSQVEELFRDLFKAAGWRVLSPEPKERASAY